MGEADGEDEASAAAEREADETLERRVRGVLRHDPDPSLPSGARLQEVAEDLVEMGQLIARDGEERLGALPDAGDRREQRQRSKAPMEMRLGPVVARRIHWAGIIAGRVVDARSDVDRDDVDTYLARPRASPSSGWLGPCPDVNLTSWSVPASAIRLARSDPATAIRLARSDTATAIRIARSVPATVIRLARSETVGYLRL